MSRRKELYFAIAVGAAAEALKDIRLKMGEGIAGWVAKHGEQVILSDVDSDPRFAKRIDEATHCETRSVICVPLRSRLRVLGVIQLVNANISQFSEQEIFFLQALCDYAAIAIENARWVEKIQELTITDDCTGCTTRGIFIRRWRPRFTVHRGLDMSSACCSSIWTASRR